MCVCLYEWMGGWTEGSMDRWVDGCMDLWMYGWVCLKIGYIPNEIAI